MMTSKDTDSLELVTKIKNADYNAFREFFEQYQHFVYNICYRMCGNRETAEDITQEVFIKIFQAIGKFRGEAKLSSWIYRISVNTCLKKERRKKLDYLLSFEFLFQDAKKFQILSPEETPDQQLEISETENIVQQAIYKLPDRQKTALVLHRYESLSYQQIAEVMNISLSAVESLLYRAKENLTEILIPLKKYLQ
jgi:RNA polymerase sigma-70 factor (ECF subfamily)